MGWLNSKLVTCLVVLCCLDMARAQQVKCMADVAILLDQSGSIRDNNRPGEPDNWESVLKFVEQMVSYFNVAEDGTHVGVVKFANRGEVIFPLDAYYDTEDIKRAILGIEYKSGNTNTTGGLKVAREQIFTGTNGDRPYVANIVILLTDGKPTRDVEQLGPEVRMHKDLGHHIVGIGVTKAVNNALMEQIVTSPPYPNNYFFVDDFSKLAEVAQTIAESSCIALTTPAPAPTPPPPTDCAQTADIIFVVDSSGSIGYDNFEKIKGFLVSLIGEFNIEQDQVRVGLIKYSTSDNVEFQLNRWKTRDDAKAAVQAMEFQPGTTNTGDAIKTMREVMFTSGNGARNNVPKIAVVLTDGGSTNKQKTYDEGYAAKKDGIHIISLGVGKWTDVYELERLASYPSSSNNINIERFEDLVGIRDRMRDLLCNNNNECNNNPCQNGGQCVDGIDMYWCSCTSGYAGQDCESPCRQGADVIFSLDGSGSLGQKNFLQQMQFIQEVTMGLNLNKDSQIGLQLIDTDVQVRFNTNEYDNKYSVLNAMSLYYKGGSQNIAKSFQTMRETMFTSSSGSRKVSVTLSDSRSMDSDKTISEARLNRLSGVEQLILGVGGSVNDKELFASASDPADQNYIKTSSFDNIESIREDVISAICNEVDECMEKSPCKNGGQCIDGMNGYKCVCRDGYSGVHCERACSGFQDIILVIDSSGSIRNERFPFVQDFIINVVENFEVSIHATRFGALVFSDDAEVVFDLNTYSTKQDVIQAIKTIDFKGGRTHTSAALRLMKDEMFQSSKGDRSDAQNLAIIFTDGNSNVNAERTVPDAIDSRLKGIHSIVVAVGTDLNMLEMKGMASEPVSENVYTVDSFTGLPGIVQDIVQSTCDEKKECDPNPCRNGGTCRDLLKRYSCECSADWTGEDCNKRCTRQMDLAFVLDLSGSMDVIYDIIVTFARKVTFGLPMTYDRARVGLVSYSDQASVNFYLDSYTTREEVLSALAFGKSGGRTNTQEAIRKVDGEIFTASRGDRSGVPNKIIMVTDGKSNVNPGNTLNMAEQAKRNGAEVYVVAIGDANDMAEINGMASDPDSQYVVRIRDAGEVNNVAENIIDRLCQ